MSRTLFLTPMTQVTQRRRTRILPPITVDPEEERIEREKQHALKELCRPIFEQLRPSLIQAHPNWYIAIDPDNQEYLLDPTLKGITQQIRDRYTGNEVKVTIFRLNETGTCGRLWV